MPFPQPDKIPTPHGHPWFTLEEAAEHLPISAYKIQDLVLAEKIESLELDGIFWIHAEELERIRQQPEILSDSFHLLEEEKDRHPETVVEMIRDLQVETENAPPSEHEESPSFKMDTSDIREVIPVKKETHDHPDKNPWRSAFQKVTEQLRKLKPLSQQKWKEWMQRFFQMIEEKRRKEVQEEEKNRQVSVKLGFMTGRNELFCDFCEINDHFYPGAIFADVYVDGALKWMMCPNCLHYCRQQANGSMEKNIRARFNQLAFRLEQEARRARNLATSEDFQVPQMHEWEAWETASLAMQEVASSQPPHPDDSPSGHDS
ncbi:hypothetical protein JOD24_002803 [Kroppenstedtia sanguinis]|mgnify:CR=1 FL=1|uniref:Helix-turn-helix domain-containing protein n=1 Tax=Kroppenstedtia sanguinis TaxID=1380684 RepID=A0ABW4CBY2_9BACL